MQRSRTSRFLPWTPTRVPTRSIGLLLASLLAACGSAPPEQETVPSRLHQVGERPGDAFRSVARVLRHPRCLNCHPSGDRPRVGEDGHLHLMNVQRGPGDQGRVAMRCDTCHRDANQEYARLPGAPHWQLAPLSMGWEGLDDHGLAEVLKDRSKNGARSLEALLEHVSRDPLVLWGWDPGRGREPVPMPHADFVSAFERWVETGAVSPEPGTTSTF